MSKNIVNINDDLNFDVDEKRIIFFLNGLYQY